MTKINQILVSIVCVVLIVWGIVSISLKVAPYIQAQVKMIDTLKAFADAHNQLAAKVEQLEKAKK